MRNETLNILIIIGSSRQNRLGDKVGAWARRMALAAGRFDVETLDIADLVLPPDYPPKADAAVMDLRDRVARADGFLVVTPEYNHSFPAPLKHAIDQAYEEWRAKPVAFVSYGGISGGLRAVEALRLVFAELQAVTLRDGVSFPLVWSVFGETRSTDDAAQQRAAGTMFAHLAWWATALKQARRELPVEHFLETGVDLELAVS